VEIQCNGDFPLTAKPFMGQVGGRHDESNAIATMEKIKFGMLQLVADR
jgi:hypothetical protein